MGRTAVVYFLLEQPYINPNKRSVDGLTALMMAAWWGYAAVVHLLLRHPHTDVNAQNEVGHQGEFDGAAVALSADTMGDIGNAGSLAIFWADTGVCQHSGSLPCFHPSRVTHYE